MRRIAATSDTDVDFEYMPPCRTTTTTVAEPEGQTLTRIRRRDRQRDHEKRTHPAEQEEVTAHRTSAMTAAPAAAIARRGESWINLSSSKSSFGLYRLNQSSSAHA